MHFITARGPTDATRKQQRMLFNFVDISQAACLSIL
jgi:hypothetical protein